MGCRPAKHAYKLIRVVTQKWNALRHFIIPHGNVTFFVAVLVFLFDQVLEFL